MTTEELMLTERLKEANILISSLKETITLRDYTINRLKNAIKSSTMIYGCKD